VSPTLRAIEAQLDLIELALEQGRVGQVELEEWAAPDDGITVDSEADLRRVLDRIQATIARVEKARAEVGVAIDELRRRRAAARAYRP
jgi:hypothetical protein